MRGLLIKDYRLLWNQRRTFGIMMLIWMIVVVTNTNPVFAVSYLIFICSIMAINTISYDQHENGITFLLSLPVSRKQYVREKYLLFLINLAAAVLFSVLFILIPGNIEGTVVVYLIGMVVLAISLMMPVSLIFGAEKGRLVIIAFAAIGCILGVWSEKAVQWMGWNINYMLDVFFSQKAIFLNLECVLTCICALAISYGIASKYMSRMEY